jgi:hypothetical protein
MGLPVGYRGFLRKGADCANEPEGQERGAFRSLRAVLLFGRGRAKGRRPQASKILVFGFDSCRADESPGWFTALAEEENSRKAIVRIKTKSPALGKACYESGRLQKAQRRRKPRSPGSTPGVMEWRWTWQTGWLRSSCSSGTLGCPRGLMALIGMRGSHSCG